MKVNEESEKVGLNLSIQKTKIMASSPITSWQIDGETMETETLFWGASKSLYFGASLVAQMVKNPPAMWETWVRSLDWEDPLEAVAVRREVHDLLPVAGILTVAADEVRDHAVAAWCCQHKSARTRLEEIAVSVN